MEANNQSQRTKAFFNFLVFFILTVGVVVMALLFSFRVPFKENYQLRAERDSVDKQKIALGSFNVKMQETINLLDSVNMPGKKWYLIDGEIKRRINEMTAIADAAPVGIKDLLIGVVIAMTNLQNAKEQFRNINASTANSEDKDEVIEQLQKDLDDCKNKLREMDRAQMPAAR